MPLRPLAGLFRRSPSQSCDANTPDPLRRYRHQLPLRLEGLEDRSVPATLIDVNNNGLSSLLDSYMGRSAALDNSVLFAANSSVGSFDAVQDLELWRTDGTAAGTSRLADLIFGTTSSNPQNFVRMGSNVYFTAQDQFGGYDLWRSDGTAAGTQLVADLPSPPGGNFTVIGSRLYFTTSSGALMASDGTTAGTVTVKAATGGYYTYNTAFVEYNGRVYFGARVGSFEVPSLWSTDGTTAGTAAVQNTSGQGINLSASYLDGNFSLAAATDGLYFSARGPISGGRELWKTDGTAAGIVRVKDINPGLNSSDPFSLTATANGVVFAANDGTGIKVWRTDGTEAGTTVVYAGQPSRLTKVGGFAYFAVTGAGGLALWKTDGSSAAAVNFAQVGDGTTNDWYPGVDIAGGKFIFSINLPSPQVWTTDGTSAGTVLASSVVAPVFGSFAAFNGKAVFAGKQTETGVELWQSDGTAAGTAIVKDIIPTTRSGRVASLVPYNGLYYFVATSQTSGSNEPELWKTDGTAAGTVMVRRFNDSIQALTAAGGYLYFSTNDVPGQANDRELWRSDGTAAGSVRVKDINPGTSAGSNPQGFKDAGGGVVYFIATDSSAGSELWRTDGTDAGTYRVKDIRPGSTGSSTSNFTTPMNGVVYFTASSGTSTGPELWRTDGTEAGTYLVKDILPGGNAQVANPFAFNGAIYFRATDGVTSVELWKSDGTAGGTAVLKDLPPAAEYPTGFTALGSSLLFGSISQLWKTDGTTAGTVVVKDGLYNFSSPVVVGSVMYFLAGASSSSNLQLWRSDGTTAGTFPVTSFASFQYPLGFALGIVPGADGRAYLLINRQVSGMPNVREVWRTDGTVAGTSLVEAVGNSTESTSFAPTLLDGRLLFAMNNGVHGRELWSLRVEDPPVTGLALSPAAVAENAANATVGTLTAVGGTAPFTFALVTGDGGTHNGQFAVSGNQLQTNGSLDYEAGATRSVRIRVTDANNKTFEQAFTVTVTDVADGPTDVTLSANTVAENLAADTAVGTLAGVNGTGPYTFSLVTGIGSADNASFAVSGSQLVTAAAFDYETKSSYSVRVRVTDASGQTFEKPLTVTVANVNEAPTDIASSGLSAIDTAAAGTVIGTLTATDPDAGSTFTFTLLDAAGNPYTGPLKIVGDQLRVDGPLTVGNYAVRIRVTDGGGQTYDEAFAVTVSSDPFKVTTLQDVSNSTDGVISLREAVAAANSTAGADTITFAPGLTGTITLSSQLVLTDAAKTTIDGPGVGSLTISGNNATRVFLLGANASAEVRGLTISGGRADNDYGGAVYAAGGSALTLTGVALTGNTATYYGGAVFTHNSTVTVSGSTLSNNSAGYHGGAAFVYSGSLTVSGSTLSTNSAGTGGGAVFAEYSNLTVSGSTLSGNSAVDGGGAIYAYSYDSNHAASITLSTLSGNTANYGGGAYLSYVSANSTMTSVTATANTANTGGGLFVGNAAVRLTGTIVAGNKRPTGGADDVNGQFLTASSYNLIGVVTGSSSGLTNNVNNNQIGTAASPLDAKLGPLADNGGPTKTHALLAGSPAIDLGDPTNSSADQRGGAVRNGRRDIGAFEYRELTRTDRAVVAAGSSEDVVVLANDGTNTGTNAEGLTLVSFTAPARGTVTRTGDVLRYTPNAGVTGADSFTYTVRDALGFAAVGTVNVTISDAAVVVPPTAGQTQTEVNTAVQTAVNTAAAAGTGTPKAVYINVDVGSVAAAVAAINALANPTTVVDVVLSAADGNYAGLTVSAASNVRIVIDGGGGQVTLKGASPALTVTTGSVVIRNGVVLTNDTDAPTILVTGGSLYLRGSEIHESTVGTQAAVKVTGGTADLGTNAEPGGNTFVVHGTGKAVDNDTGTAVDAIGNGFVLNGVALDEAAIGTNAMTEGSVNYVPPLAPPPTVVGVVVNDGVVQRSKVTSLTVTFSKGVTFAGAAAAAFELRTAAGAVVPNVTLTASVSTDGSGRTVVRLTFSGSGTEAGTFAAQAERSLADGNYRLAVLAGQVSAGGRALDGDANGTAGGDYAGPNFHRFFGDQDADRDVDAVNAFKFRQALNSTQGQAKYVAEFDYDADGDIDSQDDAQFRARLNKKV